MINKLIIAGGRNYKFTDSDIQKLDDLLPIGEVVSGGAKGADREGELWAKSHGIDIKQFLPDWKAYGKAAGPMRNFDMAEYATAVALFPGGRGTDSMCREAKQAGIDIFDFRDNNDRRLFPTSKRPQRRNA